MKIRADSVEVVGGGIIAGACYGCTSKLGDAGRRSDAGLIEIEAGNLVVSGFVGYGSRVAAETSGEGDGGRIAIHADSVKVSEGGVIGAPSGGPGDAGTIEIGKMRPGGLARDRVRGCDRCRNLWSGKCR